MQALLICMAVVCTLGASVAMADVDLQPVGKPGAYLGFDLRLDGRVLAPVRFSSNGLITAQRLERSHADATETLRFSGLRGRPGSGLNLASSDAVSAVLREGDAYPQIRFRLTIEAFDADAWQRAAGGPCPFHFLTISMPEAEAWHQRGWLNATPLADRFPLLEDVHVGSPEIAAKYSRNWSYTPPLGAQPLPVIGLWALSERLYAGLDFQGTRLRDNSEKDIATGYCWQQGSDGQFVALVYPHGGRGYQSLAFPKAGEIIASHCTLLYNADLPAAMDPNRFVWRLIWERDADCLPRPPISNGLSWIPGGSRLKDFEGPPGPGMVGGVEARFEVEGSRLIHGWYRHKEGAVPHLVRSADPGQIRRLTDDLRYLLDKMKRFEAGGEPCVFWEKPLEGRWTDEWGGAPVTTLHNSDAFIVARTWLDLYRLRDTAVVAQVIADLGLTPEQVLRIVEGCLNWARHIAWTRNEFADVPSSPFAIGGTLTSAFCLDYYFAFRDDPPRRERAEQALDLARTFVYRYLTMWPSDNDRSDRFDSAFLWEPNSGRDWCGAACANEVTWCLDTLAMVAVNTGDPILIHALRGSLDRWHLLYKERYHDALAEYAHDALTEGYALYDDTVYGERGDRAGWGWGPALPMLEPVGDSTIRVLAGMKTALAFTKGVTQAEIVDHRCAGPGDLRVTIIWAPSGPRDVSLTFPFADLSASQVWIERDAARHHLTDDDVLRPPQALWSLYLKGVHSGDTICIGRGAPEAAAAQTEPLLVQAGPCVLPQSPFQLLRVRGQPVERDWNDPDSWAGLPGGVRWAYGVPLDLGLPGPAALTNRAAFLTPIAGPGVVFLGYSEGDGGRPSLRLADGAGLALDAEREALAWQAWPPIFTRRLLIAPAVVPAGKAAVGVDTGDRLVFAATALCGGSAEAAPYLEALAAGGREWRAIQAAERATAALTALGESRQLDRLAILPYGEPRGALAHLLGRSRLLERVTCLRPQDLIEPGAIAPERFPVLLNLNGEDYIKTVEEEGDAADAVLRYLEAGGFLVLAADGPYPMYYGITPQDRPSDPLPPRMGLPIKGFEEAPSGEHITLVLDPNQHVLPDLPRQVAFPTADQRLRAVDRDGVTAGAAYTPIYTALGRDGADYGDAACLLELPGGGRVLYVWFGLLRDRDAGPAIAQALLRCILPPLPLVAPNP